MPDAGQNSFFKKLVRKGQNLLQSECMQNPENEDRASLNMAKNETYTAETASCAQPCNDAFTLLKESHELLKQAHTELARQQEAFRKFALAFEGLDDSASQEELHNHAEVASLKEELAAARAEAERLQSDLNREKEVSTALENTNKQLERDLAEAVQQISKFKSREANSNIAIEEMQAQLANAKSKAKRLEEQSVPGQADLAMLAKRIGGLSGLVRSLASQYFDLQSVPAFLMASGQIGKIERFWEACAREVRAGKDSAGMADFLIFLLENYNRTFPDSGMALISAQQGEAYESREHDRIGPAGNNVTEQVLPGLKRANGQIASKCLVKVR